TVLLANEVDLSKNQWDEIRFALKKGKLTSELGRRFSPYFYGFPMNPPKFEIFLTDSNLSVKFKTAGAEVDPAGPKAYGTQKGVVIRLRLSSDTVRFQVPPGRLIDLANRDLFGEMGADGIFFATSRRADRPLRVEVPVHIDAGPKGAVMEV